MNIKNFFLLILFITLIPGFAIGQSKTNYAVLTGKTNIFWEREMKLGTLTVPLSDNGSFNYRLLVSNAASYTLSHQNRKVELFISPGDSLNIDLTEREVVIHGTSEKLNTSLQEYAGKVLNNSMYLDNNNKMVFSLPLPSFNQKIDSLKKWMKNSWQSF